MHLHSRRSFLGLVAGGVLSAGPLAGCGSGGGGGNAGSLSVIRFFPDRIHVAGRPERLPLGLADRNAVPQLDGPANLSATLSTADGAELSQLVAQRRSDGLPRAYYAFDINVNQPGMYSLKPDVGNGDQEQLFTVVEAGSLGFPAAGDPMPGFDTPTMADPRGVQPVCTRPEPCPFHQVTLTEALASAKPVAYLVGTPAHCQTAICGPVLDLLIEAAKEFPQVTYIHSEIYADEDGTAIAPAVEALALPFEPLLYLVGADGVVTRRLDVIYDRAELKAALTELVA
ncbi:MAG: hypothetical protein ACKV2O_09520 [Acidimicrobiales bacterium]